jgi:hypothetical protein
MRSTEGSNHRRTERPFGKAPFGFQWKKPTGSGFLKKPPLPDPERPQAGPFFPRLTEPVSPILASDASGENAAKRLPPQSIPIGDSERGASNAATSDTCRKALAGRCPNAREPAPAVRESPREPIPRGPRRKAGDPFFSTANGRQGRYRPVPNAAREAPPEPTPRGPFWMGSNDPPKKPNGEWEGKRFRGCPTPERVRNRGPDTWWW